MAQRVDLKIWEVDFTEEGFNPYEVGQASAITETAFNEVKTFLGLTQKNSAVYQAAILSGDDKKAAQ